jgi:hypothetical protein
MDPSHLRHHLRDLSERQRFLRTLRPDSDRYKLWLGDLVEFVNVAYGADSPELASLRAVLTDRPRLSAEATEAERQREYLQRLEALAAVIDSCERATDGPTGADGSKNGAGDGRT